MLRRVPIVVLIAAACASTAIPNAERVAREKALPALVQSVAASRRLVRAEVDRFAATYANEILTADDVQRATRLAGLLDAVRVRTGSGSTALAFGSDGSVFAARGPQAVASGDLILDRVPDLRRVLTEGGVATIALRFRGSEGTEALGIAEIASISRSGAVIGAMAIFVPLDALADAAEVATRRSDPAASTAEACVLYADEASCGRIGDEAWAVVTTRDLSAQRPVEVVTAGDRVAVVATAEVPGDPPLRALLHLPVH